MSYILSKDKKRLHFDKSNEFDLIDRTYQIQSDLATLIRARRLVNLV